MRRRHGLFEIGVHQVQEILAGMTGRVRYHGNGVSPGWDRDCRPVFVCDGRPRISRLALVPPHPPSVFLPLTTFSSRNYNPSVIIPPSISL